FGLVKLEVKTKSSSGV
ncbi:hypothetical protein XELAEV_180187933mg, partial [Xenopus laevis]